MKKIAVILSGCGFLDGSEIQESVLTLLYIRKNGFAYDCYAPDENQTEVINHDTQQPLAETRNIMAEAARISRSKISPLTELNPERYAAIILPGGFGVAKNLFTLLKDGQNAVVNQDLEKIIRAFHDKRKPIGAICISPSLIAKIFENKKFYLTAGSETNGKDVLEIFGANYKALPSSEICIDYNNNVVSTAAYMENETIDNVAAGIEKLVAHIAHQIEKAEAA